MEKNTSVACKATTKGGAPCRARARLTGYCFAHDPELADKRTAARLAGGAAKEGRKLALTNEQPAAVLKTPDDARVALEYALKVAYTMEVGYRQVRAIVAVVGAWRDVWHAGELEDRIGQLERLLSPEGSNHAAHAD